MNYKEFIFNSDNFLNWLSVLEILCLERHFPFFEEMGLPASLVKEPSKALPEIRPILIDFYKGIYKKPMSHEDYSTTFSNKIRGFFEIIERTYNDETATALYVWSMRFIVDSKSARWLHFWSELFFWFCNKITDEVRVEPAMSAKTVDEICTIIKVQFDRNNSLENYRRIEQAQAYPYNEWEQILAQLKQRSYGDIYFLDDPIGIILDRVSVLIETHKTYLIWVELNSILSDEQIADLLDWGRLQILENGYPDFIPLSNREELNGLLSNKF
ncbi:MAG TPA: hypothetical protein VH186_29815 [Chloroflexia bacterium]|nr:hypothetical protein [Chloroflexia bacterium]